MTFPHREQIDELKLIAEMLDTFARTRPEFHHQVGPLPDRIRGAIGPIESALRESGRTMTGDFTEKERPKRADGLPELVNEGRQTPGQRRSNEGKKVVITKPSSVTAYRIPREKVPGGPLQISKEVSKYIAATLYNILEGATRISKASSSHIFIRKDDEMISIANCAARLAFPPQLVHHRCLGSVDAEVLGSGIALNQYTVDSSRVTSSLLIFPVFTTETPRKSAVAVVHMENKCQGTMPFSKSDEGVILTTSQLIGQFMSMFPQMDWVNSFFDPVTQHILAPFEPKKRLPKPTRRGWKGKVSVTTEEPGAVESQIDENYWRKIEECEPPLLIKRESLPRLGSNKASPQGLSAVPTLREIDAYVENMQSCWNRGISNYVGLSEEEHSNNIELKVVRRELTRIKALYEEAEEQLRLYRLEGQDYECGFRSIKGELDSYIRKRNKTDIN
ncbi:hypothetical protein DPX39_100054800 [Trypanosoma brucei equiperdum]|uniref:Uncharacterized protein n=1 Tax=Trypanosoma brucei equiperdum TaxID=630700 RepID=A0A3L6KZG6_9TRYP|nr:hypothetical protein DPX39_100054800 [Trypanosoma brucei equiperdum]